MVKLFFRVPVSVHSTHVQSFIEFHHTVQPPLI